MDVNLRGRDHTLQILKTHLQDAQTRMKNYANAPRTEQSFEINDLVFLRLQPYRQTSIAARSFSKLSPRFYGPFHVLKKIEPVAYKLELPPNSCIRPVFQVFFLEIETWICCSY